MEYCFCDLKLHKVATEAVDGVKSVGWMEKLGMKREGDTEKSGKNNEGNWADLCLYGLLQDEFQSMRS